MTETTAPATLHARMAAHNEANPYKVYADYQDRLPDSMIENLLAGEIEQFEESCWEYELQMQDSIRSFDNLDEYYTAACKALGLTLEQGTPEAEEAREAFDESFIFDFSDYWRDCAGHSKARVTVTPLNPANNEPFYAVHWQQGFAENLSGARALRKALGITGYKKIESIYAAEVLRICGVVDLVAVYDSGKGLNQITISPSDSNNALFHDAFNGSGNLGPVVITKTATLDCTVRLDSAIRYGVDSVYGFTNKFWDHDLTLSHKESA